MILRTNISCKCMPRITCSSPIGRFQLMTATLFIGYKWWQWRCWLFREMSTLTAYRKSLCPCFCWGHCGRESSEYVLTKLTAFVLEHSWNERLLPWLHCPHFWGISMTSTAQSCGWRILLMWPGLKKSCGTRIMELGEEKTQKTTKHQLWKSMLKDLHTLKTEDMVLALFLILSL